VKLFIALTVSSVIFISGSFTAAENVQNSRSLASEPFVESGHRQYRIIFLIFAVLLPKFFRRLYEIVTNGQPRWLLLDV